MTTITTRAGKNSPLSNVEVDGNFNNLNTDKLELGQAQSSGTANGVLYLNGSKQPASGSALTFDGAQLFINGITVGRGAGAVSTNTAVGASALAANTTGSSNTAVGLSALAFNTTGTTNSALGLFALRSNTTGSNNTAVGEEALWQNTTASNNTAVGYQAAYSNTTGDYFTAVGFEAGLSTTTATRVTAVGSQALRSNTTGRNTAFGWAALYSNTTGTTNTALGDAALYSATTADGNTAVGYGSLLLNTTGNSNTAVGFNALRANLVGSSNTAVGYQAGYSNTTGAQNACFGYQAGYYNTTGNWNTFVGVQAGQNTTGSQNTFVGASGSGGAGYQVTTGAKNTIIGGYSGNQGGLDIRTASNNIVLSDGDGNPRIISDGSGYIGINAVPNGTSRLLVKGADGTVGNEYSTGLAVTGSNTDKRTLLTYDAVNDCGILASVHTGTSWRPMRVPYGSLIIGTQAFVSGGGKLQLDGGITFPATQNASSDANTLDDYERGTWTPIFSASGYTFSYTSQNGTYTKIGNQVIARAYIRLSTNPSGSSGSTNVLIGGFPFASQNEDSNYTGGGIVVEQSATLFTGVPAIRMNSNSTTAAIFDVRVNASPTSLITPANMHSSMEWELFVQYQTA